VAGVTVVVLSFNPNAAVARRWDTEVGSPFVHVFSAGRKGEAGPLYHALGFRKSFAGVWGPASINFYADQKLQGRELHPSLGQDVHMLGGDLLLDPSGRCILPYYSKDNRDRPSLQLLLRAAEAVRCEQDYEQLLLKLVNDQFQAE